MQKNFYSRSFSLDQSPEEVFDAINKVAAWWSKDFAGASSRIGDEFEVQPILVLNQELNVLKIVHKDGITISIRVCCLL